MCGNNNNNNNNNQVGCKDKTSSYGIIVMQGPNNKDFSEQKKGG